MKYHPLFHTIPIVTIMMACCVTMASAVEDKRPNIILFMADDFGYECLGVNGGEPYKTPVLDKLAAQGLRFTNCCAQPLCTPSRAKIMTGRYNFRNYIGFGELKKDEITFGHVMQQAGYETCVAGKWQLGRDRNLINHFGFDEYCLWWLEDKSDRYGDPKLIENGKERFDLKGQFGPDVVSDFLLDFMSRHQEKPFFCYYPMMLTHSPYVTTPDSVDPQNKDKHKNFADMVAYTDKIVGKITNHLDTLGLRDNTVILFVGDNGTGKGIVSKLNGKAYPGAKGSMFSDAGPHVPMVVNWPASRVRGQVLDDPIDFSDFLPTIAELGGAMLPQGVTLDGTSFAGRLRGDRDYQARDYAYICYNGKPRVRATVCARGRRYHLLGNGDMYDFLADPLFKHPIPSGQAEKERVKLQAVINRMELERREADAKLAKEGYQFGKETPTQQAIPENRGKKNKKKPVKEANG